MAAFNEETLSFIADLLDQHVKNLLNVSRYQEPFEIEAAFTQFKYQYTLFILKLQAVHRLMLADKPNYLQIYAYLYAIDNFLVSSRIKYMSQGSEILRGDIPVAGSADDVNIKKVGFGWMSWLLISTTLDAIRTYVASKIPNFCEVMNNRYSDLQVKGRLDFSSESLEAATETTGLIRQRRSRLSSLWCCYEFWPTWESAAVRVRRKITFKNTLDVFQSWRHASVSTYILGIRDDIIKEIDQKLKSIKWQYIEMGDDIDNDILTLPIWYEIQELCDRWRWRDSKDISRGPAVDALFNFANARVEYLEKLADIELAQLISPTAGAGKQNTNSVKEFSRSLANYSLVKKPSASGSIHP